MAIALFFAKNLNKISKFKTRSDFEGFQSPEMRGKTYHQIYGFCFNCVANMCIFWGQFCDVATTMGEDPKEDLARFGYKLNHDSNFFKNHPSTFILATYFEPCIEISQLFLAFDRIMAIENLKKLLIFYHFLNSGYTKKRLVGGQ